MRLICTTVLLLLTGAGLFAQDAKPEFKPSGKATATVFWFYSFDMTKDAQQASSFNLERSYLGYQYAFSEKISTKITFDVGKDDGSAFTAYLKAAQLDWQILNPVKLSMGMIGMKQFDVQEKFWGNRYIMKSFQDEWAFGSSADMGVNAEITLNKKVRINVLMVNGEGYKKTQDAFGFHRIGANVVAQPFDGLTLMAYYDNMPGKSEKTKADTATISNLAFFAGYELKDKFKIGAEYNILSNAKKYSSPAKGYDLSGFSIYGSYVISSKTDVFARFDQLASNTLAGSTDPWNYAKDNSMMMGGIQYAVVKGVKMAFNFRHYTPKKSSLEPMNLAYLNFEYKF
jgi:hypothetical protein